MNDQQTTAPAMDELAINMLLAFACEQDGRISEGEGNFETWCRTLQHIPYDDAKAAVIDYYGKHPEPHNIDPIRPAHIRKLYRSRKDLEASQARLLEPPKPKHGPMYRDTLLAWQRRGWFTDRDPSKYPERPTGNDPTRERHP